MFYVSLKNINKQNHHNLSKEQIEEINRNLSLVPPTGYFSPQAISDEVNISRDIIANILVSLSEKKIIDIEFVINCDNTDFDSVHTSTHNSFKELVDYVEKNNYTCTDCTERISSENVKVFFKMPQYTLRRLP